MARLLQNENPVLLPNAGSGCAPVPADRSGARPPAANGDTHATPVAGGLTAGRTVLRILHLEDNPGDAELVQATVRDEWPGCQFTRVATRGAFVGELQRSRYDLILAEFRLSALSGLEALELARQRAPETPFIFLSGSIREDRAVEALRSGAEDYVLKNRRKRLNAAITRALRESDERRRRRQAESRISELAGFLNQAREAVIVTDLDGRITFWNAGAEWLYGWRSDEVLGRTTDQLFDATIAPMIRTAREETFAKGQWVGELQTRNRQGDALVVESRQSLIRDEAGRPKARLCINSDITDRKRLEEQFLRAQRMENIGLLSAGIAHDLNNMLAPILLAAPMLRDRVSDPAALALLGTLERSAERGANLVRQILAFAHGDPGEHRLIQVKHLLRDIAAVITGTFPKSIRLEDHIPPDLWTVKANPTQIHQVVLNLCVNARDAMPEGGTLRLRAENRILDTAEAARIEGARPGAFLVLHIEDTGTGITPEVRRQMWQPFFTTKEAGRGTGLGLSTARGIVENHDGFIEVSSEPGCGSAFRVYLPAAEGPASDGHHPPARPVQAGKGELILVVDDESHIREMTLAILTRSGYRVMIAADGAEAATAFAQRAAEIRLVITDLHMPNLNGAMLGRALRRINPATKLLVMSGMTSPPGDRPDYEPEQFADGFLPKPFKPAALLAKVQELLRPAAPSGGSSAAPFAGAT